MGKKYFGFKIFLASFSLLFATNAFAISAPSEVENLVATPGDRKVDLQWDSATDSDGIVIGYKLYYGTSPVQNEGDFYEDEVEMSDETSYLLEGLSNGVPYYFAVTAIDDEDNESESYSVEVSATPSGSGSSTTGLTVASATQKLNTQVDVQMSAPVQITSQTDAFILEKAATFDEVEILDVSAAGSMVTLTVADGSLAVGETYRVIATSAVEDLLGNPVSSGITDSAEFVAANIIPPPEPEPEPEPEPFFDSDPVDYVPAAPKDEKAPIDATNLKVSPEKLSEKVAVLTWEKSLNFDGDVADQILFLRKQSDVFFDDGLSIGPNLERIEIEIELEQNYEALLVTVDESGNESAGVSVSFSTHLSDVGPDSTLFLAAGAGTLVFAFLLLFSARISRSV